MHYIELIFCIIVIAILGLFIINFLWLEGLYTDPYGMAYFSKVAFYKKFKGYIKERTPDKVNELLFIFGSIKFEFPDNDTSRVTMPNKFDLKGLKGTLCRIDQKEDLISNIPLFLRLIKKKKANLFVELYNSTAEGKAIIAYTKVNAKDGDLRPTFSIFLYSYSDFDSLKIDFSDPKSLFACAYVADFSIAYGRYLTLGKSELMHDYIMNKENKEA